MTAEQRLAAIMDLMKVHGLDGTLDKDQIVALSGVCLHEFDKETELAAKFLGESPSRESVLKFYKAERAKEATEVGAQVDTSRSVVDIGKLKGVGFNNTMWDVVKESRFLGHIANLDAVGNYYAAKWGKRSEGTHAIDLALILQRCDEEAFNCKNPPSSYPDWVVVTQAFHKKQPVRFQCDTVMCEKSDCSSKGQFLNEAESFYLFAKRPLWRRLLGRGSFYVCPYCGGTKVKPLLPGRVDEDWRTRRR